MIIAVGIDVANLERLRAVWQRHPERFLYKHFTAEEIKYVRSSAKEAFQKCWPESHGWKDVWVEMNGVKPELRFSEKIQNEMNRKGWTAHLSLTHDKDTAAAVVVLEQR